MLKFDQESLKKYLQDAGIWGETENLFFLAGPPVVSGNKPNIFGMLSAIVMTYIINKNEKGIGIIPIDQLGEMRTDSIILIPNDDITSISLEDVKVFGIKVGSKVVIEVKEGECVEFTYKKRHSNMVEFYEKYKCKRADEVTDNIKGGKCL